jgi:hypothetical protein
MITGKVWNASYWKFATMANYISASIYKLNFVLKCKLNLVIVAHVDSVKFVLGLRQDIWMILI